MAKKDKLYVKRYKTLKEHRAAVAARKALKGGKNKGPVADAAAYGETLKKKAEPTKSKSKPKASKPQQSKPAANKPKNSSSSNSTTGTNKTSPTNTRLNRQPGSTGGRGGSGGMPSNPPSPTVTKKGSNTGAAVDPRERALRRNLKEVNSNRSSKGRKNIQLMVNQQSGSSKRNQKQVEDRRRRAREQGAKRNRNSMFARRYMDS